MDGTVFLEAHPLDSIWARIEAGNEQPKRFKVGFANFDFCGRDADMVKPPPEPFDDWRRFMVEPASEMQAARRRLR